MISPDMLKFAESAIETGGAIEAPPKQKHRQICCHETDQRPLYECLHVVSANLVMSKKVSYTINKCGNLMHADCIEKYGKCHKNSGVREWQSHP